MSKTIRFTELVQKSGRPYATTLWGDPDNDGSFSKAIRENRVVTVKQETVGSKKDYGIIGFNRERKVSYLVFPKKLPAHLHARVVGIKYDLLETLKPSDPVSRDMEKTKKKTPKAPEEIQKFTVLVRRTAVWERNLQVNARTEAEARKQVEEAIKQESFAESEAVMRHEIRDVSRSK